MKKFDESIDVSIILSKYFNSFSEVFEGFIFLPYSFDKFSNIIVFIKGFQLKFLKKIGFKNIGFFNLINKIKFKFKFDVILINFKYIFYLIIIKNIFYSIDLFYFITNNLISSFYNIKLYSIYFKSNQNGVVNFSIGKCSFNLKFIKFNLYKVIKYFFFNKPYYIKKNFINKIFLSSTMGNSFELKFKNFI